MSMSNVHCPYIHLKLWVRGSFTNHVDRFWTFMIPLPQPRSMDQFTPITWTIFRKFHSGFGALHFEKSSNIAKIWQKMKKSLVQFASNPFFS